MKNRKLWHQSITEARVIDACERRNTTLDCPGFCLICGNEAGGVEPDARKYECEACGAREVYGCEELLMELM